MAKVSIIVPVYKTEKYLHRCIDSILAQTFQDFELLLINDGSPDNSGIICEEYAKKDSRIKVFHKENGGASSARNLGLDFSNAPWIIFVDSDDFIDPLLLEDAFILQERFAADIVEYGVSVTNGEIDSINQESPWVTTYSGKDMLPRIYQKCAGGTDYPVNKLYNAKLFKNVRFEVGRICEDTLIMPRLYYQAGTVAVTDKVYYFYFQSDNSVMRSGFSLKNLDIIYALQQNRMFYQNNKLSEAKEWLDSTYSFVLVKMMWLTQEKYGKSCTEYLHMKTEYCKLLPCFLRNKYILFKQKLLLLYYLIVIHIFTFFKKGLPSI